MSQDVTETASKASKLDREEAEREEVRQPSPVPWDIRCTRLLTARGVKP